MENIQIFNNEEFGNVRVATVDSEPWFVGKDVARALGYSNPQKAVRDHVDDEDRGVNEMDTPSGRQNIVIINESGLYALIFGSKLESAKKFKQWVTSEVLPSIRKHGGYIAGQEDMSNEELLSKALLVAQSKIEERDKIIEEKNATIQQLDECIQRQKPLADFAIQVTDTSNAIDMGQMAKLLKDDGINIGRNKLFQFLRSQNILMKNNTPYQRYMNAGLFKVNETVMGLSGTTRSVAATFVTGKGQVFISNKVKQSYSA